MMRPEPMSSPSGKTYRSMNPGADGSPLLRGPGDAVVEQQPARAQPGLQEAEVRRIVAHADVLQQADGRHRIEVALGDVPVVAVAHLGQVAEPLVDDRLLRPGRLLPRQRHARRSDPTPSGVAHHATPPASDVQQPVARLEPELLEDQPVLVLLRLFERRVGVRVARAGVGHRRPEHPLVEGVRDVVVVMDRLGVPRLAVPQTGRDAAPARRHLLRGRRDRAQVLEADGAGDLGHEARRRPPEHEALRERLEQLVGVARVHTVDVEVTGDVRAGEPQVAEPGGEIRRAAGRLQIQAERRILRSRGAPVVGGEPQRQLSAGEDLEHLGEGELSALVSRAPGIRLLFRRAVLECGHRRCTAFAYRSSSRESGS